MFCIGPRFIILVLCTSVALSQDCRTLDDRDGTCILVKNCEPIMKILVNSSKPLNKNVGTFLRNFGCGFEGNHPKACCPKEPAIPGNETKIPDVSARSNLGLLPQDCGPINVDVKIVHGNSTGVFEFPWMAMLWYRTAQGLDFRCGGSVINNRYVLTAAHCIKSKYPLVKVRVGEHDVRTQNDCEEIEGKEICASPFQDLEIEETIVHPRYVSAFGGADIALIRVKAINFKTNNVRPICLPTGQLGKERLDDLKMVVAGWGKTEEEMFSPVLLKAELPFKSSQNCFKNYKGLVKVTRSQICAGGVSESDSCTGDSGGPLAIPRFITDDYRMVQYGIVSFGPTACGAMALPGVYTFVPSYMDWILDSIN